MPPKKQRVSLTKAQIQEGVGAELLTLCQAVTADGVLTAPELTELRAWLDANRASDLPAIDFLVATLERILADGKVTQDERKELYNAIEKVLPPEARRIAVAQRKTVEAQEKEHARQERATEKERERVEREQQRPIYSVNFMVAGVHYEGRGEIIRRYVQVEDRVYLARDPDNPFSRNAIEVRLASGYQIGFVPEDYAPEVAPLLDDGFPHKALVTKVLCGGRVPIPVVQAYLYRRDADVERLVFPDDVPTKQQYESERRSSAWDDIDDDRVERRGRRPRAAGKGCLVALPLACAPATLVVLRACGLLG